HLGRLRRKLDLGEEELAVGEAIDLPGEIPVGHLVALFDDAVAGGQRPELLEEIGRAVLLDLGAANAGAELHAADEPHLAVGAAQAPETLLEPIPGDPALLDPEDLGVLELGHAAQEVLPLDLDAGVDAELAGELDDLADEAVDDRPVLDERLVLLVAPAAHLL